MALGKLKVGAVAVLLAALVAVGAGLVASPAPAHVPAPLQAGAVQPAAAPAALADQFGDPLPAGAIQRLGTLRFRHGGGKIDLLLVSPDGKTLVTKTFHGDGTICVWELATGKLLRQFPGHHEENGAVALSPDGRTIALGDDYSIRFHEVASGRELRQLRAPLGHVEGLAISPDGTILASGHNRNTVLLWDLKAGTPVARIPAQHNRLTRLAFTADGKTLVTGDRFDPTVRLIDVAARKERQQLTRRGNTRMYLSREFTLSPDGGLLALGAQQSRILIWNVKTGRLVRELRTGLSNGCVAFAPDGKMLASAEHDARGVGTAIDLWDATTGKRLRRLTDSPGPIYTAAFTPDGKTLLTGSGGIVRCWDVATGKECGPAPGNPVEVSSVVLSPDGRTLAYKDDSSIRLWDRAANREVGRLPVDPWNFPSLSLAFSPDGKTLAGGTGLNRVNLWDVAERRVVRRLESNPRSGGHAWVAHYHMAFSPDGKLLASGGRGLLSAGGTDALVQLWDLTTGKPGRRFVLNDRPDDICQLEAVAFSPDGKFLAASAFVSYDANSDGCKVRLWEVATGKPLANLSAALNNSFGKEPQQPPWFYLSKPTILPRLAFSADGKMLALNRVQKSIPVWETATGKLRLQLEGHRDSTIGVAFAPDGRTLASAGWDNTIRLWDLGSGKELRSLTGHRGPAESLAFAPDGKTLISAGYDTTILFWDVAAVAQRPPPQITSLSPQEWEAQWAQLAGADAAQAYQAMQRLIAAGRLTLDSVTQPLHPAAAVESQRLDLLLKDLDGNQFAVREKATRELEQLADTVEPELRRALAEAGASLEVRRRLERILAKVKIPSGPRLQELRAVEVLERIGTPEALEALKRLAGGAPGVRLTEEAKASLERLARRATVRP
jgi:WD40 repeat protein